jgi:hypothetical protein
MPASARRAIAEVGLEPIDDPAIPGDIDVELVDRG